MPRVGVNVPKRRRPRAVHTVVIVKIHTNENVGVAGTLRAGADTAPPRRHPLRRPPAPRRRGPSMRYQELGNSGITAGVVTLDDVRAADA